ncbi:MAG: Transcription elongation factor, GreA/GreB family/N-terminal domain of the transcription EF GreA [Verrucomicrobia bacterium]|nr:MAG: Transcription elongation factor, GreA/GreB family/N-terminal domain of the transcription EF GreA [Verrucomicrobiota bacterium]
MDEELARLLESAKIDRETATKIDRLPPGAFCTHKSWGVGKVDSWDLLGDRLVIHFEAKPGHAMKLQFAATALSPLPAEHILARRFEDRASLSKLAEEDPVELVRLVLASHQNEMSLDQFDAVVKGTIVSEGKYKSWWDGAKKRLRGDRRFVIPSKRNQPMQLRRDDQCPAEDMVREVLQTADLRSKAKAVESILRNADAFESPEQQLQQVVNDLSDSAQKGAKLMLSQAIELLLARADLVQRFPDLSVDPAHAQLADLLRLERDGLGETLRSLGVSRQRQALEAFPEAFGERWTTVIFGMLNTAGIRGVGELAKFVVDQGRGDELDDFLRVGLQQRAHTSDLIAWICKERKGRAANVVDLELAAVIMNSLERDHFGDETRRTNRLAETLQEDPELIPDLIENADLNMVRGFARRLMMSPAFDQLSVKSLLARIVKRHPQIQDLITGNQAEEREESIIVSWESLEAKQKELDHLVNVLQPKNREEIKIAREYGDLRENFEYKAAKQQEAVLRRQREETERDLHRARGTDFSSPDLSKCSIGTYVDIEDESGRKETFCILGAWDSDPDKGIIAYTTGAGQALVGKAIGETAELPTEDASKTRLVTIKAIRPYRTSSNS